jgi:hypothetical protein
VAAQIDEFIEKIAAYREGRVFPFTFELVDPSGNSFVQNPNAPNVDTACVSHTFLRSIEDYSLMGYNVDEAAIMIEEDRAKHAKDEGPKYVNIGTKAVKTTKEEQDALLAKMLELKEQAKQRAFA